MNSNCSNSLNLRNLQEQVVKAFCYQKLFWPFTVWMNCSSDRNCFCKFSAFSLEFQKFSRSLEQFFPTVGQNNFGNKIPFLFLNNSNWEKNRGENWENRMICFLVNELWWNYENLFLPLITALFLKQMVKVHFWSVVKFLLWLIKIFRLLYSVW